MKLFKSNSLPWNDCAKPVSTLMFFKARNKKSIPCKCWFLGKAFIIKSLSEFQLRPALNVKANCKHNTEAYVSHVNLRLIVN